jgi:hypothetical protein
MINTYLPYALVAGVTVAQAITYPSRAGLKDPIDHISRGGQATCVSGFLNVSVQATNEKFNFSVPQNQSQVTEIFLEMITPGSPFPASIMGPKNNVSATYEIAATYCAPLNNTKPDGVQLLTHGVGFDR